MCYYPCPLEVDGDAAAEGLRLAAAMLLVALLGRPGLGCAALLLLVPTPPALGDDVTHAGAAAASDCGG